VARYKEGVSSARDASARARHGGSAPTRASADSEAIGGDTVDVLLDRWLASRNDVREVTRQGYRDVLVPVRHHLGDHLVAGLATSDVLDLVDWMLSRGGRRGQPLSPRSVAATLGALSQALDLALREETVTVNVARAVERPRQAPRQEASWTQDDVLHFREYAAHDRLAAAWLLSLTGLRRAEVLGLRWQDVDVTGGRLRVEQGRVAVTPTSDVISALTSRQGRRCIQVGMVPGVLPALRRLLDRQADERTGRGEAYHDSGLVVVDEGGLPLRPAWYSDRFAALCRGAGVPTVSLRSLRCTALDFLLGSGVRRECVRDWLGQEPEAVLARCRRDATYRAPL
jgi:integrase